MRNKKVYKLIYKNSEHLIILIIWGLVIASIPVIMTHNGRLQWKKILDTWYLLSPLVVISCINHFILVPSLIIKSKRLIAYVITILLLIGGTMYVDSEISESIFKRHMNELAVRPDSRLENHRNQMRKRPFYKRNANVPDLPGEIGQNRRIPPFISTFILSLLVIGVDTGMIAAVKWFKTSKEKSDLEKESINNELAFLRTQVSPHFFMNTLNNIHSLVDIDQEQAKESILGLSKLMRHLLYESKNDEIPIIKEIEFLQSYVELMKLRYSDKVNVTFEITSDIPDKCIPPLLFTSFVENAFKHGINLRKHSFITMIIEFKDENMQFLIKNSNYPKVDGENSGIGLENSKKRLTLLYGDYYDFDIFSNENIYQLTLRIPL